MPSSMCWPVGALGPLQHRVLAPGPPGAGAEHAHPVDEAGQVGRRGHVRRRGDQVRRHRLEPGQLDQDPPERLLGGDRPGRAQAGGVGHGDRGRGARTACRARCSRRAAAHCPAGVIGSSRSHSVASVRPSRVAQLVDLLGGQQRRVVARVAGDRQAPALDRVGEQHARPVLLRVALGERLQQRAEVVAGQVGDQRRPARRRAGPRRTRSPSPGAPSQNRSRTAAGSRPNSDW